MKRNNSVDLARIVASFGVIAIHVTSSTPAANLFTNIFWVVCVPFFLITSLFYFIKSAEKSYSLKDNLVKIGQRLYIPFIAWSAIYAALLVTKNILTHQNKEFSLWRIFMYGNSSAQMYFQPLLISLQLLIVGSIFLIRKKSLTALLLILLVFTFFIIGDVYNCFGFSGTIGNIGLLTYILFGYLLIKLTFQNRRPILYAIAGLLTLALTYLSFFNSQFNITIGGYWVLFPFGGLGLLLLCFGSNIPELPNWVKSIANNTYGIYLSHIVFLECFELVVAKVFKGMEYTLINKLLFTLSIFIAAHFFTVMIRKINFLRIILLGER